MSPTLVTAAAGIVLLAAAALFASRGRTATPPAADSTPGAVAAVPAAPASPPAPAVGTTSQAARAVLTRDDSLAIAQAVRAQLGSAPPARGNAQTSTRGASQATVADRRVIDSIVRASLAEWSRPGLVGTALRDLPRYTERLQHLRLDTLRLPGSTAPTGPRRIVITEPQVPSAHPELAAIGASVVGGLRDALGHQKGYQLVDQNAVRGVLAKTREASQVAARLDADVIASVDLIPVPGDSVVLLVKIRDLTAQPQYSYRVAGGRTMAASELPAGAGPMIDAALGYIDEMTSAPRRTTRIVVVPDPPATPDR